MSQSMYGAVDLAALAARPEVPTTTDAEGNALVHGPFVVDVTTETLQGVLDMSSAVPVLVVFRSDRSESSLTLDARLVEAAKSYGGRFQLGRIDVDAFPEAVQAFKVTGIPAACALLQGQPIPLFQGLPAEGELDGLIDQLLAAGAQYGISGVLDGDSTPAPEPELPEHHRAALEALAAGDFALSVEEFRHALTNDPTNEELKHGLAQAELMERIADVANPTEVLQAAAGVPLTEVEAHLAAADIEVAAGHPDAGFARLIDVIKVTSGDVRDSVRTRLLSLFEVVGPQEPLVADARRALANALF